MAIIDKKQTRWYSKSTFDSLDKTTIPVGTEIQVTGPIEESDLDSDLQTKINGKLTTPTTPTADSVVTMAANGTTGTKPLSEFGEKLYKHELTVGSSSTDYYVLFFPSTDATAINTAALVENNAVRITGATGFTGAGNTCMCEGSTMGALIIKNITTDSTVQFDYSSMTNISDKVTEL